MAYTIQDIQNSGGIVVLSDASKWQVAPNDKTTVRRWSRGEMIELAGYQMTNVNRGNQTVQVKRTL